MKGSTIFRQLFGRSAARKYGSTYAGAAGEGSQNLATQVVPLVYGKMKVRAWPVMVPSGLAMMERSIPGTKIFLAVPHLVQGGEWAICQGPTLGTVSKLWLDDTYSDSLAQPAGTSARPFTRTDGALSQAPWTYLSANKIRLTTTLTVTDNKVTIEDSDFDKDNLVKVERTYDKVLMKRVYSTPTSEGKYRASVVTEGQLDFHADDEGLAMEIMYDVEIDKDYAKYGFGGTALLRNEAVALSPYNDSMPEIWVEQQGLVSTTDCNPVDVIYDLLTNTVHGLGIDDAILDFEVGPDGTEDTSARVFCEAAGYKIAFALSDETSAADLIDQILVSCDCQLYFHDGLLRIYPNAEVSEGAWTAWSTIAYSGIDEDNMLEPPNISVISSAASPNVIPVSFMERTPAGADPSPDQLYLVQEERSMGVAAADRDGVRLGPTVESVLVSRAKAQRLSAALSRRSSQIDAEITLTLSAQFQMLEPGDLIQFSYTAQNITDRTIKIESVTLDSEDRVIVLGYDWLGHPGHIELEAPEEFDPQSPQPTIAPVTIGASLITLDPRSNQVLLGACARELSNWGGAECYYSWDTVTWQYLGYTPGTRMGVINDDVPVTEIASSDDYEIDFRTSFTQLDDKDTLEQTVNRVLIDSEILGYAGSESADFFFDATFLRGRDGTTIAAHEAGSRVTILDENILALPVTSQQVGETLYVKWLARNTYGTKTLELDDVPTDSLVIPASVATNQLVKAPLHEGFERFDLHSWELVAGETNTGASQIVSDSEAEGGTALQVTGQLAVCLESAIAFNQQATYRLTVRYKSTTSESIKAGLIGLAADRATWSGKSGDTTFADQPVGLNESGTSSWQTKSYHWSGVDSAGLDGELTGLYPSPLHEDTRYLRIWMQLGSDSESVSLIDTIHLEELLTGSQIIPASLTADRIASPTNLNIWPNSTSESVMPTDAVTDAQGPNSSEAYPQYNCASEFGDIGTYNPYSGSKVRCLTAPADDKRVLCHWIRAAPGQTYFLEAQAYRRSGGGNGTIKIAAYDLSFGALGGPSVSFTNSSYERKYVQYLTPADTAWIRLMVQASAVGTTETIVQFDSIQAYLDPGFYRVCGYITSTGTLSRSFGPQSITTSRTSTGIYKITESTGGVNWSLAVPIVTSGTLNVHPAAAVIAGEVIIEFRNNSGTLTDTDFYFSIQAF